MSFCLLDLCQRTDADYALLHRRTDACAQLCRSYELQCTLPAHCVPSTATIGFCRTGNCYLLYIRPRISCTNTTPMLSELFSPGMKSFTSFSELTAWLRQLGNDLSSDRRVNPPLFTSLRDALSKEVLGQQDAVDAAAFRIVTHLCKTDPLRPLSLVLYGPTGVGKSELGKAVASTLRSIQPQCNWHFAWTELNTFTQPHSLSRLVGAPPGYIGYGDRPIFDLVRQNPYTVFMFDELDKAHPEILKAFMSILDEGRYTAQTEDEQGQRELDFRRCIFIFTTNADLTGTPPRTVGFCAPCNGPVPSESEPNISDLAHRLFRQDESARRAMVRSGALCEIAARFTSLIGFKSLDETARQAITSKQIIALGREFGLHITAVSPSISSALTPPNAFSVRSTTAILEGILTPFFAAHSAAKRNVPVQLCGSLTNLTLCASA